MVDRELLSQVLEFLHSSSSTPEWHQLAETIDSFIDTPANDWWLPMAACEALGVQAVKAIPASSAIVAAQMGIILVDDILDQDPRGLHQQIGPGRTANLAMSLEALAFNCITNSSIAPTFQTAALGTISRMFQVTAFGQDEDSAGIDDENHYWTMIRRKSTPFYGCALELGAYMAEAEPEQAKVMYDVGLVVGEIVQLHDDLYDALESPAKPDWRRQADNLLILYALRVDHIDKPEFIKGLENIEDLETLERLQTILVQSGAVSYCAYQLTLRHQRCLELISDAGFPYPQPMIELAKQQIQPVRMIIENAGGGLPRKLNWNA